MRQIIKARRGSGFDSALERRRWQWLRCHERCGRVRELNRQVVFPLDVNDIRVCKYIADFVYLKSDGTMVVEDVKGFTTEAFRLKKKLMKACYGIEVKEVGPREVQASWGFLAPD